jgi:hypothetical protein
MIFVMAKLNIKFEKWLSYSEYLFLVLQIDTFLYFFVQFDRSCFRVLL